MGVENDETLVFPEHEKEHQSERKKQNVLEADLWTTDSSGRGIAIVAPRIRANLGAEIGEYSTEVERRSVA